MAGPAGALIAYVATLPAAQVGIGLTIAAGVNTFASGVVLLYAGGRLIGSVVSPIVSYIADKVNALRIQALPPAIEAVYGEQRAEVTLGQVGSNKWAALLKGGQMEVSLEKQADGTMKLTVIKKNEEADFLIDDADFTLLVPRWDIEDDLPQ